MFYLICDGRVISDTMDVFTEICSLAATESGVSGKFNRTENGVLSTPGRMVSVWSGPLVRSGQSVRGVTRHARYVCGSRF